MMTAITPYFDKRINFKPEDFVTLQDILLDRITVRGYFNPVCEFLSQITGYQISAVEDSFRYVRYFDKFSNMPFAKVLVESEPDAKFWWDLYCLYDEDKPKNNCDMMLKFISHLL